MKNPEKKSKKTRFRKRKKRQTSSRPHTKKMAGADEADDEGAPTHEEVLAARAAADATRGEGGGD